MNTLRRPLNYDKRLAGQLAVWAIKKDVTRALVELITNSDDSYNRLSSKGTPGSGIINVKINRKHKGSSIIEVIDQAEGFDYETMDKRVGTYAADTSGFTDGMNVRGFFGRGLKDAILALGEGKVQSIKNMHYYECSLTQEEFILNDPVSINKKSKNKIEESLNIRDHGTKVIIHINKQNIPVPYFDNLVERLERYYSLRDINSSDKRTVIVAEINDKKVEKRPLQTLKYKSPVGDLILDEEIEILYDSFPVKAQLYILKAKEILDQQGPCREGGILVCGKNSVHDITLFGYENDQYANRLFGRLECNYIDDLLKNNEPIISDERDGLDWKNHEFALAMREVVVDKLKPIVKSIRNEEERKKRTIENEKTRQRHIETVKKLNRIARQELIESFEKGEISEADTPRRALPPEGFNFIPAFYKIVAGRRSSLSLKLTVPWVIPDGTTVSIESDNDDFEIVENQIFTVNQEAADDKDVITINPKIVGRSVGTDCIITAKAGNLITEAYIAVVSKLEKKASKKKKREAKKGLFSGIRYDSNLDPRIRHYFDRKLGIISISTRAPSVSRYLGLNGEGQDDLHCQVLIAELVNDAFCREIARRKAERGYLQVLGNDMTAAINKEINQLTYKYAQLIHEALLSKISRN